MNRRQFLTLATVVTAFEMAQLAVPGLAAAKGPGRLPHRQILYRGTHDGKLYQSSNRGKTWQLIANFGSNCAVDQIVVRKNRDLKVKLVCEGHKFDLSSKDIQIWRTV